MPSNQNSSFQGFKGNMFNIPPTSTQDGQPVSTGSSAFGTGAFGSQQTQPSFAFGGNATTSNAFMTSAPSNGGMFGQSSGGNIFSTSQPFTTSSTVNQADKSADQMQMSPEGKPGSGSNSNIFNVSAPAQPSFTSSATTTATPFNFAGSFTQTSAPSTSTTSAPAATWSFSASTPASTPFLASSTQAIGSSKAPSSTDAGGISAPAAFAGGSLFGRASKLEEPAKTDITVTTAAPATASTSQSIFGAPSFGATSTTSTLFGTINKLTDKAQDSTTKKDATAIEPPKFQFGKSLFGASSKPQEPEFAASLGQLPSSTLSATSAPSFSASTSGKPFFGGVSKLETSETEVAAAAPSTTPSFTSSTAAHTLFPPSANGSFFIPRPSQPEKSVLTSVSEKAAAPTSSIFASATAPSVPSFPSSTALSTLFGSKAETTKSPASGPLFEAVTAAPSSKSTFGTGFSWGATQTATAEPSKPLISSELPSGEKNASKVPATGSSEASEKSLAETKSGFNVEAPKVTEKAFGASDSTSKPIGGVQSLAADASQGTCFPSSIVQPTQPAPKAATAGAGALVEKPAYVDSGMQTQYDVESEVAQLMPSEDEIPLGLNKSEKADWIKRWRFQYINENFKNQIASIDASCNDFEALIAYYVMLRWQIGYPCSMVSHYRAVPYGSKRIFHAEESIQPQQEESSKKRKTADQETEQEQEPSPKRGKSQTFDTSPSISTKRKATDVPEGETSPGQAGKRTKVTEDMSADLVNGEDSTKYGESNQSETSEALRMFISSYVAAQGRQPSPQPLQLDEGSEKESAPKSVSSGSTSSEDASEASTPSVAPGASPAATNGRSLFDRVELDQNGQLRRQIESDDKEDEAALSTARKDADPIASLFTGTKFASSFNTPGSVTPQFSFTSAGNTRSPSPSNQKADGEPPKTSLPNSSFANSTSATKFAFGAVLETSMPKAVQPIDSVSAPNLPTTFGSSTSAPFPASKFTEPEKQSSNAMLSPFPLSANTSVEASRATTPAASDTGAGDATEESGNLPQVDFTKGGAGEEDEDVEFEIRARALKLKPGASWEVKGVGMLRILKRRDNGRARMLLRADPSGNVILNAALIPQVDYAQRATSVQFLVPTADKAEHWALKLKEAPKASELAATMEECKKRN
ncbi:hypothetical protein PRK78_006175 [Emydomyces testavorans]|uniref:RanBD1 domain-containing protein n=1 Tax=Emydomyces testavorans TaxID=2070801 RepID=A0AAF0IKM3_9EURO|nr:hypothetical protein PRK78_006175 [Emydomyces testavorans]